MFRIHDAVTGKLAAFTREEVLFVAPTELKGKAVVQLQPSPGRLDQLVVTDSPRDAAVRFRCPVRGGPVLLRAGLDAPALVAPRKL